MKANIGDGVMSNGYHPWQGRSAASGWGDEPDGLGNGDGSSAFDHHGETIDTDGSGYPLIHGYSYGGDGSGGGNGNAYRL